MSACLCVCPPPWSLQSMTGAPASFPSTIPDANLSHAVPTEARVQTDFRPSHLLLYPFLIRAGLPTHATAVPRRNRLPPASPGEWHHLPGVWNQPASSCNPSRVSLPCTEERHSFCVWSGAIFFLGCFFFFICGLCQSAGQRGKEA